MALPAFTPEALGPPIQRASPPKLTLVKPTDPYADLAEVYQQETVSDFLHTTRQGGVVTPDVFKDRAEEARITRETGKEPALWGGATYRPALVPRTPSDEAGSHKMNAGNQPSADRWGTQTWKKREGDDHQPELFDDDA